MAAGELPGPADGVGRRRRSGRVLAGGRPAVTAPPGERPGHLPGGDARPRGDGDPPPAVLQHRLGGIQPGGGPPAGARVEPVHQHHGPGRPAAADTIGLLDLHRGRGARDRGVLPRRIVPARGAGLPPRIPPSGRRLDGPPRLAPHRSAHLRAGPVVAEVDRAPSGGGPDLRRRLQLGRDRRRLPPLLGAGGVAMGPVRPGSVGGAGPMGGPHRPRTGLLRSSRRRGSACRSWRSACSSRPVPRVAVHGG